MWGQFRATIGTSSCQQLTHTHTHTQRERERNRERWMRWGRKKRHNQQFFSNTTIGEISTVILMIKMWVKWLLYSFTTSLHFGQFRATTGDSIPPTTDGVLGQCHFAVQNWWHCYVCTYIFEHANWLGDLALNMQIGWVTLLWTSHQIPKQDAILTLVRNCKFKIFR